jgi:hypothetical protein
MAQPSQRPQVIKRDRETPPDSDTKLENFRPENRPEYWKSLKFLAFTELYEALLTGAQEVASPRGFEPRFSP